MMRQKYTFLWPAEPCLLCHIHVHVIKKLVPFLRIELGHAVNWCTYVLNVHVHVYKEQCTCSIECTCIQGTMYMYIQYYMYIVPCIVNSTQYYMYTVPCIHVHVHSILHVHCSLYTCTCTFNTTCTLFLV